MPRRAGGADDGANGGIEVGTSCGLEAADELAIGGGGTEFAGEKYWVGIMDSQSYGIQTLAPYFVGPE